MEVSWRRSGFWLVTTSDSVVFALGARRARRPGTGPVGFPRTIFPDRSTMQPYALTTTNARTLVGPDSRCAPPCPAIWAPAPWLAVAEQPAPRAPSGNHPGRSERTAARPTPLAG